MRNSGQRRQQPRAEQDPGAATLRPGGARCRQGGGSLELRWRVTALPSRGTQGRWAPWSHGASRCTASCGVWCTAWPWYPHGSGGLPAARGTIPGDTSPWHLQVMLDQRKASAQDRGGHNQDARGLDAGMLLPPPSFSIQLTGQPAPEPIPKHKGGWARGRTRVWGRLGPRQCQQAAAGLVTALQLQPRGAREAGGWGWEVEGGATARPP